MAGCLPLTVFLTFHAPFARAESAAAGPVVYPGCDMPRPEPRGRVYYVDPARGSADNDGSEERPWRTLAEVLAEPRHLLETKRYSTPWTANSQPVAINPKGSIRPGDTLLLRSGDHGNVEVRNYVNGDFVRVEAAPGATPVITSLKISASSHWLFRGLKFESARPLEEKYKYDGLVTLISDEKWAGPTDNVLFLNNSFSTENSTDAWTAADWVSKPFDAAFKSNGSCISLTGNHFYNIRNGAVLSSTRTIAEGNLIETLGNDGIDIAASDIILRGNTVRDSRHTPTEPLHADGIQGWTLEGRTNRRILIEGNTIINLNQSDDNYLQGISIFDGKWNDVTVVNNTVITNTWNGIALYGVENLKVINNTVLATRPKKFPTWLAVQDAKDRTSSRNVVVRNNIATKFNIIGEDVTVDHNISSEKFSIQQRKNGSKPESIRDIMLQNTVSSNIFDQFIEYDLKGARFDLRPRRNSPAWQAGAPEEAPETDILRRRRTPPVDIGAYAR